MVAKAAETWMKLEIDLDVPEGIIGENFEKVVRQDAILRLFSERKIPAGDATRLLGLTRMQFMDFIQSRNIAYVDYTVEDWESDSKAIEEYKRRRQLQRSGE